MSVFVYFFYNNQVSFNKQLFGMVQWGLKFFERSCGSQCNLKISDYYNVLKIVVLLVKKSFHLNLKSNDL